MEWSWSYTHKALGHELQAQNVENGFHGHHRVDEDSMTLYGPQASSIGASGVRYMWRFQIPVLASWSFARLRVVPQVHGSLP